MEIQKYGWSLFNAAKLSALRLFLFSVVADGKDGDRLPVENFSLNFSKFSYPSSRQNQKCTMDHSYCKKLIDISVLNFKAMSSASVTVTKKDFSIFLAGKQQKCPDRAPLNHSTSH